MENINLKHLPKNQKGIRKSKCKVPIKRKNKFHASVMVLGLISNKADVMPSHSPECNPQAYHVWSVFEQEVNRAPRNTVAKLIAKITEVMGNLPRDTVGKACKRFWSMIEYVVEAGGDFFE